MSVKKEIHYFATCGEVNTDFTLELAIRRAKELGLKKVIIASETGLSALKALKITRNSDIKLIVVTSSAGTHIENTIIGNLKIGISDDDIKSILEKEGIPIVRATDPFHNIGAVLEQRGIPTLGSIVRKALGMISSGTPVCVTAVIMATDNGILTEGEDVIAIAGSWIGLDTALILKAFNSVNFFKRQVGEILEIICKPRYTKFSWPINQEDWKGDLNPYSKYSF